jgi:hypothetical protein
LKVMPQGRKSLAPVWWQTVIVDFIDWYHSNCWMLLWHCGSLFVWEWLRSAQGITLGLLLTISLVSGYGTISRHLD